VTRFSIAEVLVGYELADDPARDRAAVNRALSELRVLEFDARSMRLYPHIYAHLRAIGRLPGNMDMLIASVALAHGQRFVTRNAQHYLNVPGLRVDEY
jgi:tRNA(fMet)-specific endonuclease VapC